MGKCRYTRLRKRLSDAFVCYQLLGDDKGQPRNLIFHDLNPVFEEMAGIKKKEVGIGQVITKMPAGLVQFGFDWLGAGARLSETGEPLILGHYSAALNRWYEVKICKDEHGYCGAIFRDISRRKKEENKQKEAFCLMTALLDNIPNCFAMILEKHTRRIVASNRTAQKRGAVPGRYCFRTIGERDDPCPFCRAPGFWASGQKQHIRVKYNNRWYEGTWAPFTEDLYVHYIIDINDHVLAEQKAKAYTKKLEQLYHRLEEKMEKVKEMHKRALLPEIPPFKGCSLAAHYQPAQRLGGDFYDVIKAGPKLVLYLSDVSGHGPEGALLSMFVKEAINSYVSLKPDAIHPERILRHLCRQYLRENYPEDYFICIFLAVLDLPAMELSYTGAGFQTSPLVQMSCGKRLQLISEGLPISNCVPDALMDFTVKRIALTPGTTIFFNTDGLVEQEVEGAYYGDRLPNLFFQNCHLPPEAIARAVNEDFRKFNKGCPFGDDDITFVVLKIDHRASG